MTYDMMVILFLYIHLSVCVLSVCVCTFYMRPNQMRYHPSAKKIWGPPLGSGNENILNKFEGRRRCRFESDCGVLLLQFSNIQF